MGIKTFYFQIHQSFTLKNYTVNDIEVSHSYFDIERTREKLNDFSEHTVLPFIRLMDTMIAQRSDIRFVLDLSEVCLELLQQFRQDVILELKFLTQKGKVTFLVKQNSKITCGLYSKKDRETWSMELEMQLGDLFGHSCIARDSEHQGEFLTYINIGPFVKAHQFKALSNYIMAMAGNEIGAPNDLVADLQLKDAEPVPMTLKLAKKGQNIEKSILASGNKELVKNWWRLNDVLWNTSDLIDPVLEQSFINIMADMEILLIRSHLNGRYHFKFTQRHLSIIL